MIAELNMRLISSFRPARFVVHPIDRASQSDEAARRKSPLFFADADVVPRFPKARRSRSLRALLQRIEAGMRQPFVRLQRAAEASARCGTLSSFAWSCIRSDLISRNRDLVDEFADRAWDRDRSFGERPRLFDFAKRLYRGGQCEANSSLQSPRSLPAEQAHGRVPRANPRRLAQPNAIRRRVFKRQPMPARPRAPAKMRERRVAG